MKVMAGARVHRLLANPSTFGTPRVSNQMGSQILLRTLNPAAALAPPRRHIERHSKTPPAPQFGRGLDRLSRRLGPGPAGGGRPRAATSSVA